MSTQTIESAFEAHVEDILLQTSGWVAGTNAEWDVERAAIPDTGLHVYPEDANYSLEQRCENCMEMG